MRTHSSPRGVTLVELLVAMTVTAIVIAGATVVVRSQQKAYLDGQKLRGAQGSARRALLALEQSLPSAGFGMDASLAIDLSGWYANGPCPAVMAGCPKDSIENSDELVFFARDSRYWVPTKNTDDPVGNAWRISAVTTGAVSVNARAGDVFRNGQIFLAVCSGSSSYAYFTASETVQVAAAGVSSITLAPVTTSNPFLRQDVAVASACFSAGVGADPARLFLVNRYRFHVRPVITGTLGAATQYDPLLVLDQGVDTDLDGDVDANDEQLIAEGIESIQVSYVFNSDALAPAGTTAGSAITLAAGTAATAGTGANAVTTTLFPGTPPASPGPNDTIYTPSSFYPYTFGPPAAAERGTNHQANVQAIRVSVLARSTSSDIQGATRADGFLPVLNQAGLPAWVTGYASALGGHDGYQRVVLDTTVGLPNMATRAMTYF